ncbi:MAG: MarC family protein [Thermodesulfobacteriota bacterium]
MTLTSAAVLLFLVMDPFGNIPFILSLLKDCTDTEYKKIVVRELFFAFLILLLFLSSGKYILSVLHLSNASLSIAGGVILFIISIKMIFSGSEHIFEDTGNSDFFIVPIAIPSIAGPSSMATVMLLMAADSSRWNEWVLALTTACAATGIILLISRRLRKILGRKGLKALDSLMGMLLTTISVEMLITGIKEIVESLK